MPDVLPGAGESPSLELMRGIDLFDGLDPAEIEPWREACRLERAADGDLLAEQNEQPRGVVLLFEGAFRALVRVGERWDPQQARPAPTWALATSVMTEATAPVRIEAVGECLLAWVEADDFRRLVREHASVHSAVMRVIAPVLQGLVSAEQNREHLTSLGTMAAGLAHELNNPAAAARRAADQLGEALGTISSALGRFVEAGVEREDAEHLLALQREALERSAAADELGALEASDAEDELTDRLDELGVEEPWRLVEPLAAAGLDRDWIDRIAAKAGPATEAALGWVAAGLTAQGLVTELADSTTRMSELVGAIKSYAYMDRAELTEVDVNEGLKTTMKLMKHKVKHTSIDVDKRLDEGLPRVAAHGSELNQVWTNLIDNAIDALGDSGRLEIVTRRDGDAIVVEVADDGPGIPDDVRGRIFDSFFTTKDVGQGTGLGLATAHRIVAGHHGGTIDVRDGWDGAGTRFVVRLPLDGVSGGDTGRRAD